MRGRPFCGVALLAAAGLVASSPVAGEAVAATSTATARTVVDVTPGHAPEYDARAVGDDSDNYLVYAQNIDPPLAFINVHVLSDADGSSDTLKPPAGIFAYDEDLSVVQGNVVTSGQSFSSSNADYWLYWNLAAGTQGALPGPTGVSLQDGAPDGFVAERESDDELMEYSESGQVTALGQPFGAGVFARIVVSDQGLLAYNEGTVSKVSYMPWGDPGVFTALDVGGDNPKYVDCSSLGSGVAGCSAIGPNGDREILRIPTDGSAPVETDTGQSTGCDDVVAATSAETLWECGSTLYSVSTAGGAVSSRTYASPSPGLQRGASGVAAVVPRHEDPVETVNSASDAPADLVPPQHQTVAAGEFALARNTIVYEDDKLGHGKIFERHIHDRGASDVTVGRQHPVKGLPDFAHGLAGLANKSLAATGRLIAAANGIGHGVSVRFAGHTRKILAGQTASTIEADGTRIAVTATTTTTTTTTSRRRTFLYDAATGHETPLNHAVAAAVCGNHALAIRRDQSVDWLSTTGKLDRVLAPAKMGRLTSANGGNYFARAYCDGDEAGWFIHRFGSTDSVTQRVIDVATRRPTQVHGSLISLTPAGVLSAKGSPAYFLTRYGHETASKLVSGTLPPVRFGVVLNRAAVNQTDVAWINPVGRLDLERLPR